MNEDDDTVSKVSPSKSHAHARRDRASCSMRIQNVTDGEVRFVSEGCEDCVGNHVARGTG
jgi:hypothetical protein